MKTSKFTCRNLVLLIAILSVSTIFSCKKLDLIQDSPIEDFAGLAYFNAINVGDSYELNVDGKAVNNDVENFKQGEYLTHRTIFPGQREISLRVSSAASYLINEKINLEKNGLYSIFFYGNSPYKYFLKKDDLNIPSIGKIKLRIANLIEKNNLDINIAGTTVSQKINLPTGVTDFLELNEGKIKLTLSSRDLKTELFNLDIHLDRRNVFTLCLYEVASENDPKIKEIKYYLIKY